MLKQFVALAVAVAAAVGPAAAQSDIHYGKYHALVIGNNAYQSIGTLKTAVVDAEAVAATLKNDYRFEVTLLRDASRADILRAMTEFRRKLTPNDNLLIYYAGHGILDQVTERGYWLPVDAAKDDPTNWISNADIADMLRAIRAKHVMVVADSCYAGTLTRNVEPQLDAQPDKQAWLARVSKMRARTALASGGLEPVADSGGGKHSVFANAFLRALKENAGVLEGQMLFDTIKRPVALDANQTPAYSDIRQAGHEGGDFLFVRATAAVAQTPAPAAVPAAPTGNAVELTFWQSIQNSTDAAAFREYLTKFPTGTFAGLAQIKSAELEKKKASAPQLAALTPSGPVSEIQKFDGVWAWEIDATGTCAAAKRGKIRSSLVVQNGTVQGRLMGPNQEPLDITGTIASDGKVELEFNTGGGRGLYRGTVSSDEGRGSVDIQARSGACGGQWTMKRNIKLKG